MSRIKELIDRLPRKIVVDDKDYFLSLEISDGDYFDYKIQYADITGWPAEVIVTEDDGSKWKERAISCIGTLEECLEDIYHRIENYI